MDLEKMRIELEIDEDDLIEIIDTFSQSSIASMSSGNLFVILSK